jgi:hypothetical protein
MSKLIPVKNLLTKAIPSPAVFRPGSREIICGMGFRFSILENKYGKTRLLCEKILDKTMDGHPENRMCQVWRNQM